MPSYGVGVTLQYQAWNTSTNAYVTGDSTNHTLRWVKDGTASATTNSPSEIDATNAPGVYKVVLTTTETQCQVGTLCGKSSTSNVILIGATISFENIPTATAGNSGGLFIAGTNAATTVTTSFTTTFTGDLTGSVASVTGAVGSVTGNVGGNVVGSVASVTGNVGGNVTGSVGSVASGGITAASIATDAIDADALAADAVTEIWAKTMTELSAVPSASASMLAAITWLFEMARNKYTETSTTGTLFKDDGSTTLATVTVSDDGTTFTRGKAT